MVPPDIKLPEGPLDMVPPDNELSGGTVPPDNKLSGGMVPPDNHIHFRETSSI